jgi:long-chain acyl-CoA synthetase
MEKIWLKHYQEGVPESIDYPDIPLTENLIRSAADYPDRIATSLFGNEMTYRELNEAVNAFSHALIDMGVKPKDRVAIILPNSPAFVVAYYGILKAGAFVVPTNPMYTPRELEHQFSDSGAETVVTLSLFFDNIISIKDKTKLKNIIVVPFGDFDPKGEPITLYYDLLEKYPKDEPTAEIDPDDIASFQYTGGTTGLAKGVMLTHKNLVANVEQCCWWNPWFEASIGDQTTLCVIPFFHSFGMTVCMNLSIRLALKMALIPRFDIDMMLAAIKDHKPNLFPGVPTIYTAILNHPEAPKYDFKSIDIMNSGSAPLPVEIMDRFEKMSGGRIMEGYGLSESSPVTHTNPIYGLRKTGSIGVPVSDTESKIVDVDDGTTEMPVGESGELILKGPQVMKGYWNKPEETKIALRDGWLYTGDIGYVDEDGFFYIVDRKKDMIIAGGYNIYPRDVDEVLYEHPKVMEAAVIGVPDEYRGETVKAFVVLKEGETATADDIIGFCKEKLAAYKVPKIVEFIDALPKTAVGKVLRKELKAMEMEKMKKK